MSPLEPSLEASKVGGISWDFLGISRKSHLSRPWEDDAQHEPYRRGGLRQAHGKFLMARGSCSDSDPIPASIILRYCVMVMIILGGGQMPGRLSSRGRPCLSPSSTRKSSFPPPHFTIPTLTQSCRQAASRREWLGQSEVLGPIFPPSAENKTPEEEQDGWMVPVCSVV